MPHLHLMPREAAGAESVTAIGAIAGVVGGVAMALPLVVYDWARDSHSLLELPMAATGWLFGLEYFGQNDYRWWPIVIGALFVLVFWITLGLAFAGLAERVYRIRTLAGALALGTAWSFASFMFFWYMLLPIARDGAPFRLTTAGELVAPTWVWILGFTLSGLATGICYWALRRRAATRPVAATPS